MPDTSGSVASSNTEATTESLTQPGIAEPAETAPPAATDAALEKASMPISANFARSLMPSLGSLQVDVVAQVRRVLFGQRDLHLQDVVVPERLRHFGQMQAQGESLLALDASVVVVQRVGAQRLRNPAHQMLGPGDDEDGYDDAVVARQAEREPS